MLLILNTHLPGIGGWFILRIIEDEFVNISYEFYFEMSPKTQPSIINEYCCCDEYAWIIYHLF